MTLLAECSPCAHATEHGHWGQPGTHCGFDKGCHRSWTGLSEAHCKVCHQHFVGDSVADMHEPYCTTDRTVTSESLMAARSRNGNPIFELRDRKSGPAWGKWNGTSHPRGAT